jgi:hypothetical protein
MKSGKIEFATCYIDASQVPADMQSCSRREGSAAEHHGTRRILVSGSYAPGTARDLALVALRVVTLRADGLLRAGHLLPVGPNEVAEREPACENRTDGPIDATTNQQGGHRKSAAVTIRKSPHAAPSKMTAQVPPPSHPSVDPSGVCVLINTHVRTPTCTVRLDLPHGGIVLRAVGNVTVDEHNLLQGAFVDEWLDGMEPERACGGVGADSACD